MSGINKAILIGHLGADPEIRRMPSGDPVANFSVATSDTWKDKDTGERKERTEWHRVVIFNDRITEVAEKYLKKGSKVYIEGAIRTRKYTGNDGVERYSTEIVVERFRGELQLLDRAESNRPPAADDPGAYGRVSGRGESATSGGMASDHAGAFGGGDLDDEIPF